jgi:hypothetical protein
MGWWVMSMARVVITAVVVEHRSKSEVARDYGVSRRWVQTLVARYQAEGESAFEPDHAGRTATRGTSPAGSRTSSSPSVKNSPTSDTMPAPKPSPGI